MTAWVDVLVSNLAAAGVLAIIALLVGRMRVSPSIVHALWVVVLLKLITPPLFHVSIEPEAFGITPEAAGEAPADSVPSPGVEPRAGGLPIERPDVQHWSTAGVGSAEAAVVDPIGAPSPALDPWAVASWAWLIGAFAVASMFAWRAWQFRRLLRFAMPAPALVCQRAAKIARKLGLAQRPEIVVVDARVSPMVWSMFCRPRLLLPKGLVDALDPDVLDTLLAHELAHVRRGDHWIRHLELVVCAVHWWNPVVWWAVGRLRAAEEECCDGWVVWALPSGRKRYAEALVGTVEFLSSGRSLPVGASGVGRIDDLKRRITMIMQGRTSRLLSGPSRAFLFAFAALFLSLMPAIAQGASEDPMRDIERELARAAAHVERAAADIAAKSADIARLESELDMLDGTAREEVAARTEAEIADLQAIVAVERARLETARRSLEERAAMLDAERRDTGAYDDAERRDTGAYDDAHTDAHDGEHEITFRSKHGPQVIEQSLLRAIEAMRRQGDDVHASVLRELATSMSTATPSRRGESLERAFSRAAERARSVYSQRAEADRRRAVEQAARRELEEAHRLHELHAEHATRLREAEELRVAHEHMIEQLRHRLEEVELRSHDKVDTLTDQVAELSAMVRRLAEKAEREDRRRADRRDAESARRRDDEASRAR